MECAYVRECHLRKENSEKEQIPNVHCSEFTFLNFLNM